METLTPGEKAAALQELHLLSTATVLPFQPRLQPSAPAMLQESDLGPEPDPTDCESDWITWTVKAGLLRYGEQRDAVEVMVCTQLIATLESHIGVEEARTFIASAFPEGHPSFAFSA